MKTRGKVRKLGSSGGSGALSRVTTLLALLAFLIQIAGCAGSREGRNYVRQCVLPQDQSGTISGRWAKSPVPISLHTSGNFGEEEVTAVINAASTWNTFYETVNEFPLLSYASDGGNVNTSALPVPQHLCGSTIINQSGEFTGSVVIYKHGNWPYDKDIIALTSFCPIQDQPFNRIYTGIMELNYQHFFVSGKKTPDLESIMLHEFGHLVGLNHSCETFDKTGTPNCTKNLRDEYFDAVMFPVILFPDQVNGEIRQELQDNDQGRANCLYHDITGIEVVSE